ncbi:OmpH family outer membrane protein [Salinimicrobium sp. GXAS 041]|uniref:OmpH family outer membrane protein n=1 Tax=Salinimicrobium sp. GXAS 041 TaxID=3400806 RepID=UPI003C787442
MTKVFNLLYVVIFLTGAATQAQQPSRVAFVDMDYILQNIPEYQQASTQLDEKVKKWKSEIDTELNKIESMKRNLENERALLTEELIEEREEEIAFEEEKLYNYQQRRFGPNGDLMTQKLQLVKPIQDQVFIAVQEIASQRKYDLIFDKSADVGTLYVSEDLDVSEQVLRIITRASNRQQINSAEEKQELLREESLTAEQSEQIDARQTEKDQRQQERRELLEERKRVRDSIRTARQLEYEKRRNEILEERKRKKDSIAKAREENNN